MLEPWLIAILACPTCREKVQLTAANDGFVCEQCRVLYPVEDGIPQMLPEAARPLPAGDETGC